jgi:hypothetical protein
MVVERNNPRSKELSMSETNDITATILDLIKQFMTMAEERAKTLPYRINLIETLGGAYETKNSKIIASLLRYKSPTGRFEILESLINYIASRSDAFRGIVVDNPSFTTEHCHIDIYVREAHKYAVIIENKSNEAGDQNHQLFRYIEIAINEGYTKEQIFVLYLPKVEEKDPEDQSWGSHRETFKGRYVKLSWRNYILPWMKEKVLPNVRKKDIPLSSALEQYIDYWEGQFGLRGVESEVKMEMKDVVIARLKLGAEQDPGKSLEIVRDAYVNAQSLTETLKSLAKEYKCKLELSFWNNLIDGLRRGYDNIDLINLTEESILKNNDKDDAVAVNVGLRINFYANKRPFVFQCIASKELHYGFRFVDASGKPSEPLSIDKRDAESKHIEQIVKDVMPVNSMTNDWYYGYLISDELNFRDMDFQTAIELLGTHEKSKTCAGHWADRFDCYIKAFKKQLEEEITST